MHQINCRRSYAPNRLGSLHRSPDFLAKLKRGEKNRNLSTFAKVWLRNTLILSIRFLTNCLRILLTFILRRGLTLTVFLRTILSGVFIQRNVTHATYATNARKYVTNVTNVADVVDGTAVVIYYPQPPPLYSVVWFCNLMPRKNKRPTI